MAEYRAGVLSITIAVLVVSVSAGDNNHAYSPCRDTTVQRHDGFTLGLAFAGKSSFYSSSNTSLQLSPCDKRLSLTNSNAQLAVFRPKVDEISLLTVNSSTLSPKTARGIKLIEFDLDLFLAICVNWPFEVLPLLVNVVPKSLSFQLLYCCAESADTNMWRGREALKLNNLLNFDRSRNTKGMGVDQRSLGNQDSQMVVSGIKATSMLILVDMPSFVQESYGAGYMVAFAGSKYAARSPLAFVANGSHIVTSFTLVLEFKKGRLNNLYWKRDSCASCKGNSNFVCLNGQDCAIPLKDCKSHQGKVDCSLGIQLAFSGTDKHYEVLNSWYEVSNLRQYSLFGLYSNLKSSLSSQYNNIF
ncbi:hypothetical protein V2J09_006301 [Rumex salicifolius]